MALARQIPSKAGLLLALLLSATLGLTWTGAAPAAAATCTGTQVRAGADIQAAINSTGNGGRLCLASGTYSVRSPLRPKSGQQLVAVVPWGAVLTGNNATQVAVDSWTVSGVRIEGLVIERFNTPATGGMAAVRLGTSGVLVNSEVRYNNYIGVYHNNSVTISGNSIHHNYSGITGFKTTGGVIENNDVGYNNVNNARWSGGGTKWTGTRNIIVRNNNFHDNNGTGIWFDADNINVLAEGNRSINNRGQGGKGIQYEASCAGTLRNNTLTGNEMSGIEIVASQNVQAYGNTLRGNANGVRVWHQVRGSGANCQWITRNVTVRNNTIYMDRGATGLWKYNVSDGETIFRSTDGRVNFDNNTYYFRGSTKYLQWANGTRTVNEWKGYGQDVAGIFRSF